ncbi:MAG: hypothetical protein AAB336_11865, partial [Acidobacteriota bacterium]
MRVIQILLLTIGLVVFGNVLSRVSAQNNSNPKVNSNTTTNRYPANYASNANLASSNVALVTNSNAALSASDDDEYEYNFGEIPTILKIISMQRTVEFPKNGALEVQIIEEVGKPFTLRFARQGEMLAQFVMRHHGSGFI